MGKWNGIGGKIHENESIEEAAIRELHEETGYQVPPDRLTRLTSFFAAPGILDERMHLYLAEDLVAGEPQREPEEEIENYVVTVQEAMDLLRQGAVQDAKTMIGLMWLQCPQLQTC